MGFVNEYLSEKEKNKIQTELYDPRYKTNKAYIKPRYWTVDKECNIALIYCGELNRDDYNKKVFALIYKEFDNEHLLSFTLVEEYLSEEQKGELEEKYQVNLVIQWKVVNYFIPQSVLTECQETDIFKILNEALDVYGVRGNPNYVSNVKAIINVEGI